MQAQGFGFRILFQEELPATLPYKKISIDQACRPQSAALPRARDGLWRGEGLGDFLDVEEWASYFSMISPYLVSWAESYEENLSGIYCSGIVVDEGGRLYDYFLDDIRAATLGMGGRLCIGFNNDAVRLSPCCAFRKIRLRLREWFAYASRLLAYVRSPRRKGSRHCRAMSSDGNCFAAWD